MFNSTYSKIFVMIITLVGVRAPAAVSTKNVTMQCSGSTAVVDGQITADFDTRNWALSCEDEAPQNSIKLAPGGTALTFNGLNYQTDQSASEISNEGFTNPSQSQAFAACDQIQAEYAANGLSALYARGWRTDYNYRYSFFLKDHNGFQAQLLLTPDAKRRYALSGNGQVYYGANFSQVCDIVEKNSCCDFAEAATCPASCSWTGTECRNDTAIQCK